MTTALFGDKPTEFIPGNRQVDAADMPVLVTMSAPIALSYEDLVAVLYQCPDADCTNDDEVRYLIADAVVNDGLLTVDSWRCEVTDIRRGTAQYRWLTECRAIVTRVFGTPAAVPAQTRTARRALVGVTA